MKQVIFGIVSILVITMIFLIMMTIYGRSMRQEESVRGLSEAMDVAITEIMEKQNEMYDGEEFAALLLQKLIVQMNSTSDIQVKILDADAAMGILSVEVTEEYMHPNGERGSVAERRTVIFDRPVEIEKEYKTVCFYMADDALYKEYSVEAGTVCTMPAAPDVEGKTFKHWSFFEGTATGKAYAMAVTGGTESRDVLAVSQTEAYIVTENTKLIAVYE